MRIRSILIPCSALAILLLVQGVQAASAGEPAQVWGAGIVAKINAQRTANGIPGGITLAPTWTERCKKHDHYMAANRVLTHREEPGRPRYTRAGAWAGRHSVLSFGPSWRLGNAFEGAPLHLAQLLQPRLRVAGAFEYRSGGALWGCVTTWPGYRRPDPRTNHVYTYPGNGRIGVPTHYFASEGPFTPNQLVGAPARCGQELFVFVSGPALTAGRAPSVYWFHVTRAVVRPKGGSRVKLAVADGLTRIPSRFGGGHLGRYLGPGAAVLIPVNPLKPGTTYVARVTIRGNGVTLKHHWSFTTRAV